jgi:Icc-related predicted phosphoesterase
MLGAGDYASMHKGLEEVVEVLSPALVVRSHHHCRGGEAVIGTTPVVNVGPDGRLFTI